VRERAAEAVLREAKEIQMSMPADNLKWVTQESYKRLEGDAVSLRRALHEQEAELTRLRASQEELVARLKRWLPYCAWCHGRGELGGIPCQSCLSTRKAIANATDGATQCDQTPREG
jgi:hypothetical protein